MPDIKTEIKTAAQDLATWLKGGIPTRTQEDQERIHKICESCTEFYDAQHDRCKQCGCFLKPKIAMAVTSCPVGKW